MGTFHITPMAHFYDYIQLEPQSVEVNPTAPGIVCYDGSTGQNKYGVLYVSVPGSTDSSYIYRALVDTLVAGAGINVVQDSTDKGMWTITATGSATGEIQVIKVNVPQNTSFTSNGICYVDLGTTIDSARGFVYHAYDKRGDTVAVSVCKNTTNSRYVTIDFGSATAFTNLSSAVYIDIIVGTTDPIIKTAGLIPPSNN